ncbi:histidine phosphotransferase [Calocera cornea HHB12733]|uniref:Histidine phosphotransferase n=1 Tax=Calocera cornea HHB12733 TaxID=1353952 RepID=A0A165F784_9BASI|nr:histidine phosphotransferase [Calocera cornea HHB12733]
MSPPHPPRPPQLRKRRRRRPRKRERERQTRTYAHTSCSLSHPDGRHQAPAPVIDMDTFSQILEMDDDDTHEFSLSIVENYMEQAAATFDSMSAAVDAENLPELSRLGHFLKGSSAALGISQVQTGCEAMQYYGQLKRGANGTKMAPKEALDLITTLLAKIKEGHTEADKWLRDFYGVESWGSPEEE